MRSVRTFSLPGAPPLPLPRPLPRPPPGPLGILPFGLGAASPPPLASAGTISDAPGVDMTLASVVDTTVVSDRPSMCFSRWNRSEGLFNSTPRHDRTRR